MNPIYIHQIEVPSQHSNFVHLYLLRDFTRTTNLWHDKLNSHQGLLIGLEPAVPWFNEVRPNL